MTTHKTAVTAGKFKDGDVFELPYRSFEVEKATYLEGTFKLYVKSLHDNGPEKAIMIGTFADEYSSVAMIVKWDWKNDQTGT
jgi:hypothetical protein